MAGPLSQLQQRGRRLAPSLSTLAATETARQVLDEGGRRMLDRSQVDVARRLAAGAPDFQPGKPSLTAWLMVGDGSIGSPSAHIRSFQLSHSNRSACCSMVSALARIW